MHVLKIINKKTKLKSYIHPHSGKFERSTFKIQDSKMIMKNLVKAMKHFERGMLLMRERWGCKELMKILNSLDQKAK